LLLLSRTLCTDMSMATESVPMTLSHCHTRCYHHPPFPTTTLPWQLSPLSLSTPNMRIERPASCYVRPSRPTHHSPSFPAQQAARKRREESLVYIYHLSRLTISFLLHSPSNPTSCSLLNPYCFYSFSSFSSTYYYLSYQTPRLTADQRSQAHPEVSGVREGKKQQRG
jgi:hypothetical protein